METARNADLMPRRSDSNEAIDAAGENEKRKALIHKHEESAIQ